MSLNRRQFVAGVNSAVVLTGLGATVRADNPDIPIGFAEVFPVADIVILENTGNDPIELEGFVLDWEHNNPDYNQSDEIDSDVTLEPSEEISVWSGFQSTQIPDVEANLQIGDYGNGRINASESDLIALLSPDGEVIDETSYEINGPSYEDYLTETDEKTIEGDATIDVTYERVDLSDGGLEDCEELPSVELFEINDVSPSAVSGEAYLTQGCSIQEDEVEISLNDEIAGSTSVELGGIYEDKEEQEALVEFSFGLEEPLEPGEYEVTLTVGSLWQDWTRDYQETFEISDGSDDPSDSDDIEGTVEIAERIEDKIEITDHSYAGPCGVDFYVEHVGEDYDVHVKPIVEMLDGDGNVLDSAEDAETIEPGETIPWGFILRCEGVAEYTLDIEGEVLDQEDPSNGDDEPNGDDNGADNDDDTDDDGDNDSVGDDSDTDDGDDNGDDDLSDSDDDSDTGRDSNDVDDSDDSSIDEGGNNGNESADRSDNIGEGDDDLDNDDSDDQDDGATESSDNDDTDGGDESTPGFTTGAGIAGGALSLEWLRRRAAPDEPEE